MHEWGAKFEATIATGTACLAQCYWKMAVLFMASESPFLKYCPQLTMSVVGVISLTDNIHRLPGYTAKLSFP